MLTKQMQSILFNNLHRMELRTEQPRPDTLEQRKQYAASINRNLQSVGFCLDSDAMSALISQPPEMQVSTYQEIMDLINESTFMDKYKDAEIFYKNFPEEVMSLSDYELYMNQFVYYVGAFMFDEDWTSEMRDAGLMSAQQKARPDLLDIFRSEPKYIGTAGEHDLIKLMEDRIAGTGMSEKQTEELWAFEKEYPREFASMVKNTKFKSKENFANIMCHMYREGKIKFPNMSATDILRIAAVLSNDKIKPKEHGWIYTQGNTEHKNDANLTTKTMYVSRKDGTQCKAQDFQIRLSNADKRFIQRLLDKNCPSLYEDVWQQKAKWKKAMPYLGLKNAPERVKKAFDNLAHNKRVTEHTQEQILSPNEKINRGIQAARDGINVSWEEYAKKYPGLCVKRLTEIISKTDMDPERIKSFIHALDRVPAMELLKVQKIIESYNKSLQMPYGIKTKSGKIHVIEKAPGQKELTSAQIEAATKSLREALNNAIRKQIAEECKKSGRDLSERMPGKVYIDQNLKNYALPTRNIREASDNATLTKGSTIPLKHDKNLLVYSIAWTPKNGSRPTIDISVQVNHPSPVKDQGEYREYNDHKDIAWYNLRSEYGVHSGDYVAVEEGKSVQQHIIIDKAKMKELGIDCFSVHVNAWSGTLADVDKTVFTVQERDGSLDMENFQMGNEAQAMIGKLIEGSEIVQSIEIPCTGRSVCLVTGSIEQDKMIWQDEHYIVNGTQATSNPQIREITDAMHANASLDRTPSMYDLVTSMDVLADSQTDNIKEADIVFTSGNIDKTESGIAENAKVITSMDLGTWYALAQGDMSVVLRDDEGTQTQEQIFENDYIDVDR